MTFGTRSGKFPPIPMCFAIFNNAVYSGADEAGLLSWRALCSTLNVKTPADTLYGEAEESAMSSHAGDPE